MLVTFEGLDAAGKSLLMREVAAGLRSTLSEHVLQLPDISASPTGRRLGEVFRADELFGNVDSTVISRCLAAAADLFYFDGALIAPNGGRRWTRAERAARRYVDVTRVPRHHPTVRVVGAAGLRLADLGGRAAAGSADTDHHGPRATQPS